MPEELAKSSIREGTDSQNNGAYMLNPSSMSRWTDHMAKYLKCGSTKADDLEFNKLDIHHAGVRSERPTCDVEDAELRGVVEKHCSGPPLQVAFQSSPAVGAAKRYFNPWLDPSKLPEGEDGPRINRRNVAVIEDDANTNVNGQDADAATDATAAAAAKDRDWATQYERDLAALPLTDSGTWTTEILLHPKLKMDRLRWIYAKCTNVEPKDVPKHNKKDGARKSYKEKMAADVMTVRQLRQQCRPNAPSLHATLRLMCSSLRATACLMLMLDADARLCSGPGPASLPLTQRGVHCVLQGGLQAEEVRGILHVDKDDSQVGMAGGSLWLRLSVRARRRQQPLSGLHCASQTISRVLDTPVSSPLSQKSTRPQQ